METETIWVSIIIPLVIGPIFIFFKNLYDRFNLKKDERKVNKYNDLLDRIRNKLKDFYWPVYLQLLYIYQFNFNIPIQNDKNTKNYNSSSSSNSSSDEDSDSEPFIKYTKKKMKRCNGYYTNKNNDYVRCKKYVPNNSIQLCRKCKWRTQKVNNEICDQNKDNIESNIINQSIKISMPVDINVDNDISLTGCDIGTVKTLSTINTTTDKNIVDKLKKIVNKSHDDLLNIIENNISIAEPNSKLGKQLVLFIKYSKIRKIVDNTDNNIKDFGVKDNTNKLLSLIEIKLFDLQKEYHILMDKGAYDSYSSDSD